MFSTLYNHFTCKLSLFRSILPTLMLVIMPHAQLSRRQAFQPSCPRGGTFYACQGGTNFVGCCTSEACSDGCSAGNLKPASFEPKHQGKFADQECPRGSQWYTCAATSPPFMGCCKSDPCKSNGCPVSDLSAGFLSSNPAVAADFLPADSKASSTQSKGEPMKTSSSSAEPSSSISSIKSTSSLSPASETSSAAPRPVHTQPTVAGSSAKHSNTRAIAGGSAGGAVAAMLLLALLLFILRRKANRSREHMSFSRAVNWGSGKEMVNSAGQGMQSDYKTPEPFNSKPQSHHALYLC